MADQQQETTKAEQQTESCSTTKQESKSCGCGG